MNFEINWKEIRMFWNFSTWFEIIIFIFFKNNFRIYIVPCVWEYVYLVLWILKIWSLLTQSTFMHWRTTLSMKLESWEFVPVKKFTSENLLILHYTFCVLEKLFSLELWFIFQGKKTSKNCLFQCFMLITRKFRTCQEHIYKTIACF